MNKNAKISMAILAKMAQGMTVRQAIDAVLGAGTAERVIADVWAAARVRR